MGAIYTCTFCGKRYRINDGVKKIRCRVCETVGSVDEDEIGADVENVASTPSVKSQQPRKAASGQKRKSVTVVNLPRVADLYYRSS